MEKPKTYPDGIDIPSSTAYLADVDRYLEEKFTAAGIDESIVTDVAISISELVNNAIIHGNKLNESKVVSIRFVLSNSELRVTVCDQGVG